jgi:hypothetical protein
VRLVPPARAGKPLVLVAVAILAGCGGAGGQRTQPVTGDGFRFTAPLGWTVAQTQRSASASSGPVNRIEVQTFRLLRPYRSELFDAASHELDRVAGDLAVQLHGRVASRATTRVADRDARWYRIDYDSRVSEITFVLDGRREYELLCRRPTKAGSDTCVAFVRSFELG